MSNIIILDESLINKIAAGEVIERPASIVKELLENSIDAGSNQIFVELKEGGKSLIKVTDNGHGMSKKDVELSWHRHSTSKIKDVKDLFSIHTLGFRGEALASIAAVSELTIISKEIGALSGNKIKVKAGKEILNEEFGCPDGTSIEVKDLFFNTPARKKYLKSMEIELRHTVDIVTRYALIHPEIHFRLTHNKKELLDSPIGNWLDNINYIYGKEIAKQLLRVKYETDSYQVEGYISKPILSKPSKNEQSIYVNKRYIKKNTIISNALNSAYKTMMMVNRYPIAILNININSKLIDVNVHPQKAQIRVKEEKMLFETVFEAVRITLQENDLIPETLADELEKKLTDFKTFKVENLKDDKHYPVEDTKQQLLVKETEKIKSESMPDMRVLGIINKTYIIAETPGTLILIDQHAAAERILYEKFTGQLKEKTVNVQELLDPVVLELTPKLFSIALAKKDFLENLGYHLEEFGHNTIIIRTIPVLLGKQFDKPLFLDFLDELDKSKKPVSLEMFFHNKIARMACRTAIKAGDDITLPQIKNYVKDIFKKDFPTTCPHGRPIVIQWSFYELEKMFKRVV